MSENLSSGNLRTEIVHQKLFPGAHIEQEWGKFHLIRRSPAFAMRLILGAQISFAPRGDINFVSMTFEGTEYILHINNFKFVDSLAQIFMQRLISDGYSLTDIKTKVRYSPDMIIDGLYWLTERVIGSEDIPLETTKMHWWLPDSGVCGEYRSRKPAMFMKQTMQDKFYAESTTNLDPTSIDWFDVFMMHRVPPEPVFALFQRLKAAGKTMIYEFDDDLFSIPTWNHNSKRFGHREKQLARACIDMADIILCSTEALKEVTGRPEDCYLVPNLVDMTSWEHSFVNRGLQGKYVGVFPVADKDGKAVFCRSGNLTEKVTVDDCDPIRIIWAGSNTHDKDLEQLIQPIKMIGAKYGIAVRFIFFGYLPPEFSEVVVSSGNTEAEIVVKEDFRHFISYFTPVEMKTYPHAIHALQPDIALCPLHEDVFNLSKSNIKVLEFGAMGIPSIASNFGPYRFIENRHDGLKVSPGKNQQRDWIEAIEELIQYNQFRGDLSRGIFKRVHEEFCWNSENENTKLWTAAFNKIHEISTAKKERFIETVNAERSEVN